ncbi:MAG: NfeD family protein [Burkholderiales bacterium]|jgi:membrane protein implicated in regulation of membrane protease activity
MCHLILLLPFLALPIFWLLPLVTAASLYSVVVVLSVLVYYYSVKALRLPVSTGREALLHSVGEVVAVTPKTLQVRVHSEIWGARSDQPLVEGDRVEVIAIKGLRLEVSKTALTT